MAKTEEQLTKDISALIKLVLSDFETLASMEPIRCEPYMLEDRKKRVVRKIWSVYKDALALGKGSGDA